MHVRRAEEVVVSHPVGCPPRDVCALKPERGVVVSSSADEDVSPPPGPEAIADAVITDDHGTAHKTVCPANLRAPCMCVLCDQAADADMLSEVDLMVSLMAEALFERSSPAYVPGVASSTRRWNSGVLRTLFPAARAPTRLCSGPNELGSSESRLSPAFLGVDASAANRLLSERVEPR